MHAIEDVLEQLEEACAGKSYEEILEAVEASRHAGDIDPEQLAESLYLYANPEESGTADESDDGMKP